LSSVPEIGAFYALGDEVIFFLHGKPIHISDEGKTDFTPSELNSLLSP
jgi:hypothetical protein